MDSYGSRKDSYDDIIKKILIENNQLKQKLAQIEETLPKAKNILSVKEDIRQELQISKTAFIYTPPPKITDETYRMNISTDKKYKDSLEKLKDYLKAVELIIKKHINPLFKIENPLDLQEWRRLFKINGLSERTLKHDIEEEFIKSGIIP